MRNAAIWVEQFQRDLKTCLLRCVMHCSSVRAIATRAVQLSHFAYTYLFRITGVCIIGLLFFYSKSNLLGYVMIQ